MTWATLPHADLANALTRHTRLLPTHVPLPVLAGVRIAVSKHGLWMVTTDFDVWVETGMQAATGDGPGEVLVGARALADMLKKLDKAQPVTLRFGDGNHLVVEQGRTKGTLFRLPVDEFPVAVKPKAHLASFRVDGHVLTDVLTSVGRASGADDTLPTLTGVHFEVTKGRVEAAATDRYRVALMDVPARKVAFRGKTVDSAKANVPTRALKGVAPSFKKVGEVAVTVFDETVSFEADGTTVTATLNQGEFPKYQKLFPDIFNATFGMLRPDAIKAAELAASVATANMPIKVSFQPGKAIFEGGVSDDAVITSDIDAEATEEYSSAFNPRFFVDGLKALESDKVQVSVTTPSKPVLITSPGSPGFRYLLMPVRIEG